MWKSKYWCFFVASFLAFEGSLAKSCPPYCEEKGTADTILDYAKDAISKARNFYPNCSDADSIIENDPEEEVVGGVNCTKKDKSFAYLDVAVTLIADAKGNYPSCLNRTSKGQKYEYTVEVNEKPADCSEVQMNGATESGVYAIWPRNRVINESIDVYCDMETDGGGWTVIQRRGNYQVEEDFYRDWDDYKNGFGNISFDFWLGNDNIYSITNQARYSVRFDLVDRNGEKGFAVYGTFWIESESDAYELHIDDYNGTVGDSMSFHNTMKFSTKDRQNDVSSDACADRFKGGWWYYDCYWANLNGVYVFGGLDNGEYTDWRSWRDRDNLSGVEIKVRPEDQNVPALSG